MYVYIIFQTGDVLSTASSSGGIHPGAVIGIDTCLQAVCKETIPVVLSNCSKSIRDICTPLWTAYRLSKHLAAKVHKGACGVFSNPLPEIHHKELNYITCHAVNKWCMHIAGLTRVCAACCTGLVPLPCAVCQSATWMLGRRYTRNVHFQRGVQVSMLWGRCTSALQDAVPS